MLLPSGTLFGVIAAYVIQKRRVKCCARCRRAQSRVYTLSPLAQPASTMDRQPGMVTQQNHNVTERDKLPEIKHKETDTLLNKPV